MQTHTMLRILPFLLLGCLIVGCSSPRERFYSPPSVEVSKPPIGLESIAFPGDPMLAQGTQRIYDALHLSVPTSIGGFILPAGNYYKASENNAAEFFAWDEISKPTQGGIVSGGQTLKDIALIKDTTNVCVRTFTSQTFCEDRHSFERSVVATQNADSFQRTLLYSGKVGNKINVSYREFADQYARAAFTNTAEYDLSESNVIGYKGAQIEVIEATNQHIRYRVLRNFNYAR